MVMLDDDDDHDAAAASDVAAGIDTGSDSDDTAPAAAVEDSIASRVRRHGAPRLGMRCHRPFSHLTHSVVHCTPAPCRPMRQPLT
eukprot:3943560-Pleurochrysis_carterae.AAC.1